jgi:hypothetical protein
MRAPRLGIPLLALLGGCGGSAASSTTTSPSQQALVTYSKSGGLGGTSERLVIDSSGAATLTEGRPGVAKTKTFSVGPAGVADLQATLDRAHLVSRPSAPPNGCADCFVYRISYSGHTFAANDVSLPASAKPVVHALDQLVASAGAPPPAGGK